jgi:hypothetical protein
MEPDSAECKSNI